MEERIQFIQDALSDRFTMSELWARSASVDALATSGSRDTNNGAVGTATTRDLQAAGS